MPGDETDAGAPGDGSTGDPNDDLRGRLERGIDRLDEGLVDLLAWLLGTETRARVYVHLRQQPEATSEEVADGTGLYPSTVRETLAALHDDGLVEREKRDNGGAGNNPYEYSAIAPNDLVTEAVEDVQAGLNALFRLDEYLSPGAEPGPGETDHGAGAEPVTITVEGDD